MTKWICYNVLKINIEPFLDETMIKQLSASIHVQVIFNGMRPELKQFTVYVQHPVVELYNVLVLVLEAWEAVHSHTGLNLGIGGCVEESSIGTGHQLQLLYELLFRGTQFSDLVHIVE